MESDAALLGAWASGDQDAGRAFYQRYAERIVRFFGRKTDHDVPDLVQRTFLRCLEAVKRGQAFQRVDAALFAIARNELYDSFSRKRTEGQRFDPGELSLEDLGTGPSTLFTRQERHRLLLEALRGIPLEDQLALELYYWEQLPMDGVAEALGVTRSAAINRVHRARGRLRERLEALRADHAAIEATFSSLPVRPEDS